MATFSVQYIENEEQPVIKKYTNMSNHILRSTGLVHYACVSESYIATCKERITLEIKRSPERPVLQIYEDSVNEVVRILQENNDEEVLENFIRNMPTAVQYERSMYRTRREVIPPNPTNQIDIDVDSQVCRLSDGTSIVVGDDVVGSNDRNILFSLSELVRMADCVIRVNIDSTFKVCPMSYSQTFILHGLISNVAWVPLFYALLPSKTEACYERLYNLIDMSLAAEGAQFQPHLQVMLDFELAERKPWE